MISLPLTQSWVDSSETDLVAQAASGDRTAFEALYLAHAKFVYALCFRLSRDAGLADELSQEVFLRAWQRLDRFAGNSRVSTWLCQIAINLFYDSRRREQRRPVLRASTPESAEAPPLAGTDNPVLRLDLERAVATLPDGAREVLLLHDIHGYRHEEIAAIVGISIGTSKSQLHRARMLLREELS